MSFFEKLNISNVTETFFSFSAEERKQMAESNQIKVYHYKAMTFAEIGEQTYVVARDLSHPNELHMLDMEDMSLVYRTLVDSMVQKLQNLRIEYYNSSRENWSYYKEIFITRSLGCTIQHTNNRALIYIDYGDVLYNTRFEYEELDEGRFGFHCVDRYLHSTYGIMYFNKKLEAYYDDLPYILMDMLEAYADLTETAYKINLALEMI